jgi:hypothetical protein
MSGSEEKVSAQNNIKQAIPAEGSLALLALGAKGLAAWRLAKANAVSNE